MAVGVAVLVGSGVAVGGTGVGDGSGVLVAGISVGVAVGGLNCEINEQPEVFRIKTIRDSKRIKVFIDLFFNIEVYSFKGYYLDYIIHQNGQKL